MNTLSRAITSTIFTDRAQYEAVRARWSVLMRERTKLSPTYHLLYLALMGRDWRAAFTPISNTARLEHGAYGGWGFWHAYSTLRVLVPPVRTKYYTDLQWESTQRRHAEHVESWLVPFEGTVTSEMLGRVIALLPTARRDDYQPAQFTRESWPFEAYTATPEESARAG
jgi:hypothetical protein